MPKRDVVLANNEIYHVYNRSIAKEQIFASRIMLRKALEIIDYYRYPQRLRLSSFNHLSRELRDNYLLESKRKLPLVEIYSFALMPNHYHFLLKQLQDNGITRFISLFQNSFAKYYNLKKNRDGGLFKNQFKAKWIETDEVCLHVSRYIHLNPVTAYQIPLSQLVDYNWTSYTHYIYHERESIVAIEFLLKMFDSRYDFIAFVESQVEYQKNLDKIKGVIFEEN